MDPREYHLISYIWQNKFYFDIILTMRLYSAAVACQHATTIVSWLCFQLGQSVFNYLDDKACVAKETFYQELDVSKSKQQKKKQSLITIFIGDTSLDKANAYLKYQTKKQLGIEP